MARRRGNNRRKKRQPSPWPRRLIGLAVMAALVAAAYFYGRASLPTLAGMPVLGERNDYPAIEEIRQMTRERLEREMAKLTRALQEKDRRIGDLSQQLLVREKGSHSAD